MNKEDIIKAIENEATVETLYKNEAYIIEIELGNMPKEHVAGFCHTFSDLIQRVGIHDFVILPMCDGKPCCKFYRVKNKQFFEGE